MTSALLSVSPARVRQATSAMLDAGIAVAAVDPKDRQPRLIGVERDAMIRAVPKRRREFEFGRAAARQALANLGRGAEVVPMGADRAPVWPRGIVGSISHCDQSCVAITADATRFNSVGIDVEPAVPLQPDLQEIICTSAETAWLDQQQSEQRGLLAKLIFSAKESTYKCQYPLTRHVFDFHGLELQVDLIDGTFTAEFRISNAVFLCGERIFGRFSITDGVILTVIWLNREVGWYGQLGGTER